MTKISNQAFRELSGALDDKITDKTKPQSSVVNATVISATKGDLWVQIDGAQTSTPVSSTSVNVNVDDKVIVRIQDGKATITGNLTYTATNTQETQQIVKPVKVEAKKALSEANKATSDAKDAKAVAEATNQHFWSDTGGVHVSLKEQSEWDSGDKTQANLLANSQGILVRDGLNPLTAMTKSGFSIYDGSGSEQENVLAEFTSGGIKLGQKQYADVKTEEGIDETITCDTPLRVFATPLVVKVNAGDAVDKFETYYTLEDGVFVFAFYGNEYTQVPSDKQYYYLSMGKISDGSGIQIGNSAIYSPYDFDGQGTLYIDATTLDVFSNLKVDGIFVVDTGSGIFAVTSTEASFEQNVLMYGTLQLLGDVEGLPIASTSKAGVVKVGDNLSITQDGTLSANTSSLASVATSGSYNDLSNKPTSLKNPYALNIGGDVTASYDGSKNTIVEITYKTFIATIEETSWIDVSNAVGNNKNVVAVKNGTAGYEDSIYQLVATHNQGGSNEWYCFASVSPVDLSDIENSDTKLDIYVLSGDANNSEWTHYTKIIGTGGSSGASWGSITGNIGNQSDLQLALDDKVNYDELSSVATSGSYSDLSNKPTSLKNPYALQFSGAFSASYDGSSAVTVDIPKETEPTVIWSGSGSYMNASQSVDLSDNPVFETSYGILLHWQYYNSGTKDQNHQFSFISKTAVDDTSRGFMCNLQSINVSTGAVTAAGKYVYITNDAITGAACNAMSNNAHFVLTEVLAI